MMEHAIIKLAFSAASSPPPPIYPLHFSYTTAGDKNQEEGGGRIWFAQALSVIFSEHYLETIALPNVFLQLPCHVLIFQLSHALLLMAKHFCFLAYPGYFAESATYRFDSK